MDFAIFGNATLDIICRPVDDVPRHESLIFEEVAVGPGGCASNVAVGLSAQGCHTALIARVGNDPAFQMLEMYWKKFGVDTRWVMMEKQAPTAVSIAFVDSQAQPRFVHTPGANGLLTADDFHIELLAAEQVRWLHLSGYFVLPGLLDGLALREKFAKAKASGMATSLDVVKNYRMDQPKPLLDFLDMVDYLFCNAAEGRKLSGEYEPQAISKNLRSRGAGCVLVKLGADGCWYDNGTQSGFMPGYAVDVVDTTGAGDAFAAGVLAGLVKGIDLATACDMGNRAGAEAATRMGTITLWEAKGEN